MFFILMPEHVAFEASNSNATGPISKRLAGTCKASMSYKSMNNVRK